MAKKDIMDFLELDENGMLPEVAPEDIDDPELRELMNENVRMINRSNDRLKRLRAGEITPPACQRQTKEDEKKLRETKRKLKEYEKRKA